MKPTAYSLQSAARFRPQSTVHGQQPTVYSLRPASAFTLLEVMLVMGIIAILVGLLFPVVIGMNTRSRQKQALAETRTILVAIKAYRQEYGKWPAQVQSATDKTYVTDNYRVIQPLLGNNPNDLNGRPTNPKSKIFLSLQVNSVNPDYAGNYLDPWGIPYVICMDENGDNKLSIACVQSYVVSNASGRQIGNTNIYLPNSSAANVDAGVASLGGTSNTLSWNSWEEP